MTASPYPGFEDFQAVADLVAEGPKGAGGRRAQSWLGGGWNPFALWESAPRGLWARADNWSASPGDAMAADPAWLGWMRERAPELSALAEASGGASRRGLSGLATAAKRCQTSDYDELDLRIALGEPKDFAFPISSKAFLGLNPRGGAGPVKPLWLTLAATSTVHGGRKLALAGSALAPSHASIDCWQAWAARACLGELSIEDLDWMGERCAPRADRAGWIEALAYEAGNVAVMERLSKSQSLGDAERVDAGCPPERLAGELARLASHPKCAPMMRGIALARGWDVFVEAFGDPRVPNPLAMDASELRGGAAPAGARAVEVALHGGKLDTLRMLCAEGAPSLGPAPGPDAWSDPEAIRGLAERFEEALSWRGARTSYSIQPGHGKVLAWIVRKLGRDPADKAAALSAIGAMGRLDSMAAREAVEVCARRGWLAGSGAGSLAELYGDGRGWWACDAKGMSFEAFSELCGARAAKAEASEVSKAVGRAPRRRAGPSPRRI